ncbi:hypothetical protein F0L74_05805 [Chitinophaga agrisoli]|uniref:Uncharacterized protein n=2 Tax=Chitinophaga agrisoli TaxID=2607653 RepID=A0A5B2W1D8_9BACT|nr:hypothetical protein F0L74_05805 [Chitinophaga agrisoli]
MQRKLQEMANNSPQARQAAAFGAMANGGLTAPLPVSQAAPVAQLKVKIGADTYKLRKRGFGMQDLINLVKANQGTTVLRWDWKAKVKDYVRERAVTPWPFATVQELIQYLVKSNRKTPAEKNREQDARIRGLNTGAGAREMRYGRILSYESRKAHRRITKQVETLPAFTSTKSDLEALRPGARSATSDFTHTNNEFINMHALSQASLQRLDFMAPGGVTIDTHGYSSRGDRTVDPRTLPSSFGLGTIKIGPDIGTYMKEGETNARPNPQQMGYLNPLEENRLPELSPQTALKRGLYNQGHFDKPQGLGYNHDHSSVEFLGAVSGSSLNNAQRDNMQRQQTLSNYAILQSAYRICPDVPVAAALHNSKHVPTAREEMDALTNFIAVVDNPLSSGSDRDNAKKAIRQVLTQILRAFNKLEDVDSEDEGTMPTSPYTPGDYL